MMDAVTKAYEAECQATRNSAAERAAVAEYMPVRGVCGVCFTERAATGDCMCSEV